MRIALRFQVEASNAAEIERLAKGYVLAFYGGLPDSFEIDAEQAETLHDGEGTVYHTSYVARVHVWPFDPKDPRTAVEAMLGPGPGWEPSMNEPKV